ncbi:hypothetical protein HYG77_33705 (plasmid) [Rhodococcus sp. ZPP]|uniref:hypothetical protein n=1 Tax=Rhodococcus sp. ZPP TaxID=2749906 RepID=UPI001AD87490|nr:hypothetical protein [Rhodococcus sp. ZPP]QTJ70480.1 hypothetical protein HYG77_33705 [Rhodococcus sp. ZPP]
MGRHRWPAQPPPTTGGRRVHGPKVLADLHCVRLQLSEIIAYPSGMQIRLALTATEICAEIARHETRALTNRDDFSAQWSYLTVTIGVDDLSGEADPYYPLTTNTGVGKGMEYRTVPRYWINTLPTSGTITLIAGWPQIGLEPVTTTAEVGELAE